MADTRQKNGDWKIHPNYGHEKAGYPLEAAQLAVLMDIRDELQTLNRVFACHNTLAIPGLLRDIKRQTNRPPVKRKKK